MKPERWRKVTDAMGQLLEMSVADQAEFLERLRKEDGEIGSEVASLLHQQITQNLNALPSLLIDEVRHAAREKIQPGKSASPTSESDGLFDLFGSTDEFGKPASPCDSERLPEIAGYQITGVLGRGGMGVVYLAFDTELKRRVALKMLSAGLDAASHFADRFRNEAEAVAQLHHPNIVQVYAIGQHNGQPYFSQELVEGGNLAKRIAGAPQSPQWAAETIRNLARAIHTAHQQGIVHRDLKPANILLADDGTMKIADFGLVKWLDSDAAHTKTGDVVGTPSYMAPEQARGQTKQINATTDVYALGAILYELMTGRPPFRGETTWDTISLVVHREPVAPRQLQPRAPRDLETICLKCLSKESGKRYASAAELADDLDCYLEGRPIHARPIGSVGRAWRWCRRNPTTAIASSVILVLLVTVAVISSLSAVSLRAERNETLNQLKRAQAAELAEKRRLFESKLTQARALRLTGRAGQRSESLKVLQEAAEMLPTLGLSAEKKQELRDEFIACSALPVDLRLAKELDGGGFFPDRDFRRYVVRDDNGNLRIHQMKDDKELGFLPAGEFVHRLAIPKASRFSPDGRYLALRYYGTRTSWNFFLWDIQSYHLVYKSLMPTSCIAFDFTPDSRLLAFGGQDKKLHLFDIAAAKDLPPIIEGPAPARFVRFRPDGLRLAVGWEDVNEAYVIDFPSGKRHRKLANTVGLGLYWSADGRFLAVPHGLETQVWDMNTGTKQFEIKGQLRHGQGAFFSPDGNWLASHTVASTHLWRSMTGQELLRTHDGRHARWFSADSRRLGFTTATGGGVWEIVHSRTLRVIGLTADRFGERNCVAFHPNGRLMACGTEAGLHFCDADLGREIAHMNIGQCRTAVFHPSGKSLFTSGDNGVIRWPIEFDSNLERVRLGQPIGVALLPNANVNRAALSEDGRILIALSDWRNIVLCDLEKNNYKVLRDEHVGATSLAISPDGKWAATGASGTSGVMLWDLLRGAMLPMDICPETAVSKVHFSPDGRFLIASEERQVHWWQVGTWRRCQPPSQLLGTVRPWAFTNDGKQVALIPEIGKALLVDAGTGLTLAVLQFANPTQSYFAAFNAQNDRLAIVTNDSVLVWNLRETRNELADLKLDWDAPPYTIRKRNVPPGKSGLLRIDGVRESNKAFNVIFWRRIVEKHPDNADASNNLAWALANGPKSVRDPKAALPLAQKAVKLAPRMSSYFNTLGVVYYRLGRYDEAAKALQHALKLAKDNDNAFDCFFLAMIHHHWKQSDKAMEYFDRAVRWRERRTDLIGTSVEEIDSFEKETRELLKMK